MNHDFTPSEMNIIKLLADGFYRKNKDIAGRLFVSVNTVKFHLRNIYRKVQAKNRIQVIVICKRLGIL